MCHLNFSPKVLFEFFEAFLLMIERYFEVKVLMEYHKNQDIMWFRLTLLFLWTPGAVVCAMNTLYAIRERKCIDWKDSVKYGLMYPVSSVFRYDSSLNPSNPYDFFISQSHVFQQTILCGIQGFEGR